MHEKLKAVSKFVNVLFLRGKNLPLTPLGRDSNSVMSRRQFITSTNQVMRQLLQVLFLKHLHSFIYVKRMFFSC